MQGRPLQVNWHPEDTPEALKAAYLAEQDGRLRTRLHGLWLVRSGWQLNKAADVVGVHSRTVVEWMIWYRRGGVREVLSHKQAGRGSPCPLSAAQQRRLVEEVATGRFRTAGEIRDWIQSEYAVSYKPGSVYGLLKRLGCSRKAPRARHEKADTARQRSWKKHVPDSDRVGG